MRQLFKIVIIGDGGVGKTTTVHNIFHYLKNKFDQNVSYKSDHNDTISNSKIERTKFIDFHAISFVFNNQKIVWQIWDLQGQRFPSLNTYTSLNPLDHITETIIKNTDLILLTYDSTDNATFNELFRHGGFYDLVKPFIIENQHFLLLGTKTDLLKKNDSLIVKKQDISGIFKHEPEIILINNTYLENISILTERILDLLEITNQNNIHPISTTQNQVSLKVYR